MVSTPSCDSGQALGVLAVRVMLSVRNGDGTQADLVASLGSWRLVTI